MKGILGSMFAIMLFAGAASAQSVRLFAGRVHTFVVPATPSSASMPTFDLVAGEPIRLQASAARMQSANNLKQMTIAVHTYPTPCEGDPVVRKGSGTQQEYLTITLSDVFISATDGSWKDTCRILNVQFKSGKTYQARIRFR